MCAMDGCPPGGDAPRRSVVDLAGSRLGIACWGEGVPEIVLLHDGLGSVAQWRSVPARLAAASGVAVVAYDRAGHGHSTPVPRGPWPVDWLHREADALVEVLDALEVERPLLVGHSDGGSIALIHASLRPARVGAVVALAAHSYVEPVCVRAIAAMRRAPEPIIAALSRYHDEPGAVFEAWSGVWVDPGFADWDIRGQLGAVQAPTWVAQGTEDEYGTEAMARDTAAAVGSQAVCELMPGLGHLLHHDAPDAVVELATSAWRSLDAAT